GRCCRPRRGAPCTSPTVGHARGSSLPVMSSPRFVRNARFTPAPPRSSRGPRHGRRTASWTSRRPKRLSAPCHCGPRTSTGSLLESRRSSLLRNLVVIQRGGAVEHVAQLLPAFFGNMQKREAHII